MGWGCCRGGFCGRRSGAALCWTQPIPSGSAADPPQAKTEPIRRVSGVSVKTYFLNGRKHQGIGNEGTQRERKRAKARGISK